MTIHDRFYAKIDRRPESGCWIWTSATSHGLPVLSVPPSTAVPAARVAWELVHGAPLPPKTRLESICGNTLCVNPAHRETRTREQRFWRFVQKSEGCWAWTADKVTGGYGRFARGGRPKLVLAHRFSYELANGPIPDGLHVLHHCDNPPCVNPSHLWLGTDADNARDCDAKGRRPVANRKLTDEDVRTIRRSRRDALSLSLEYNVTRSTIYYVRNRRTWKKL